MKKVFVTLLALLLAATMALSLVACGGEDESAGGPTTSVSAYKSEGEYTELSEMVSWDAINAFPIKKTDMPLDEARQLCVDFFRYCKTALWIPAESWDFTHHDNGEGPDTLEAGVVYGGLPYVGLASSAIYRVLDYMDPQTGVVDITTAGQYQRMFGNQCANGAYQGWSRVINSSQYNGTPKMTMANGFYRVGDYYYQDALTGWSDAYGTDECAKENGEKKLFEAYALMKHGDGIVNYTTSGHVVMIATDPVVVRGADGHIDPAQSYVTVIDQTPQWGNGTSAGGDQYTYQANVDTKWNFMKLFQGHYLPFTYAEWLGTDPIEETEISFGHEGDSITTKELLSAKITCNYHIYDSYAIIRDKKGNEVVKLATHNAGASQYEMKFSKMVTETNVVWGEWDSLQPGKDYTVEIVSQLGTGERPTLWSGKLVVEG